MIILYDYQGTSGPPTRRRGGEVLTPALLKTGEPGGRPPDSRMKWPKSGIFLFLGYFGVGWPPCRRFTPPPPPLKYPWQPTPLAITVLTIMYNVLIQIPFVDLRLQALLQKKKSTNPCKQGRRRRGVGGPGPEPRTFENRVVRSPDSRMKRPKSGVFFDFFWVGWPACRRFDPPLKNPWRRPACKLH